MPAIYRFTKDVRLEDHAGLDAAAVFGPILPVLVIDRALESRLRKSPRRAAFFCGAVAALDCALRDRGAPLIVRRGEPEILAGLAGQTAADCVVWAQSYEQTGMQSDAALQAHLEERGVRAVLVHDAPAIAPAQTSPARTTGEGYRAFAPYYERWRQLEPASFEAPLLLSFTRARVAEEPLPQPSEFGSGEPALQYGAAESLARFTAFLDVEALGYSFAASLPADDRTSHLGADLSFGMIAARTVVRETRKRIQDPFLLAEERNSLRLFLRSLATRDFFLQLSWHNPHTHSEALQEKMRAFAWAPDHPFFEDWRQGCTGFPLVDAGMRQLRATGWMHPRVRAVAASFLCFDLGVDWRTGAAAWDRDLIEDDPALATGNWQWIAGTGADLAAYPRIYNPQKQARRFDPEGEYVRRWVPELESTRGGRGRVPSAQGELLLYAERAYARPVVEHDRAARDFLRRYREFMQSSGRRASR